MSILIIQYRFKPLDIESTNSISMIFINIEHGIVYDIGIRYCIHILINVMIWYYLWCIWCHSFASMASCSHGKIPGRICPFKGLARLSTARLMSSGVMFIQSAKPFKNSAMGPDWAVGNCRAGISWSMLSRWLFKSISRSSLLSIDCGRGSTVEHLLLFWNWPQT